MKRKERKLKNKQRNRKRKKNDVVSNFLERGNEERKTMAERVRE